MGPERTCVGCRRRRSQAELIRLGVGPDGLATSGEGLAGRGAWLCPERSCLDRATRTGAVDRALRIAREPDAVGQAERLAGLLALAPA